MLYARQGFHGIVGEQCKSENPANKKAARIVNLRVVCSCVDGSYIETRYTPGGSQCLDLGSEVKKKLLLDKFNLV